jgi:hypothetical protein
MRVKALQGKRMGIKKRRITNSKTMDDVTIGTVEINLLVVE